MTVTLGNFQLSGQHRIGIISITKAIVYLFLFQNSKVTAATPLPSYDTAKPNPPKRRVTFELCWYNIRAVIIFS